MHQNFKAFKPGGGGAGVLHQIFSSQVRHVKKNWTQSDLRFCENVGQKDIKSMKRAINWIENQGENLYKMF